MVVDFILSRMTASFHQPAVIGRGEMIAGSKLESDLMLSQIQAEEQKGCNDTFFDRVSRELGKAVGPISDGQENVQGHKQQDRSLARTGSFERRGSSSPCSLHLDGHLTGDSHASYHSFFLLRRQHRNSLQHASRVNRAGDPVECF